MTLSRFIRVFVYLRLGGSNKGKSRTTLNLILAMLLSGLWHGANYTFLIWGLLNGFIMVIERLFIRDVKKHLILLILINNIVLYHLWVFFRAESITSAVLFYERLYTSSFSFDSLTLGSLFLLSAVMLTHKYDYFEKWVSISQNIHTNICLGSF